MLLMVTRKERWRLRAVNWTLSTRAPAFRDRRILLAEGGDGCVLLLANNRTAALKKDGPTCNVAQILAGCRSLSTTVVNSRREQESDDPTGICCVDSCTTPAGNSSNHVRHERIAATMLELSISLALLVLLLSVVPTQLRGTVVTAYVVRIILCYLHAYVVTLPDSQFDAIAFERIAWLWARDNRCFDNFTTGSRLYSWAASCIYTVVGRSPLVLQITNAFLGTMIVVVGVRTIRLVSGPSPYSRALGWILALHPSLLLYSAITMREVFVVLTFMLSLFWLVKWLVSERYMQVVWAICWMLISQLFHTGMISGTITICLIVAYFTITRHIVALTRTRVPMRHIKAVLVSLTLAAMLSVVLYVMVDYGYGLDKLQSLATDRFVDAIADWQERSARGRASYFDGDAPRHLVGLIAQAPARLAYFLAAPFPWAISRPVDVWGFLDGFFVVGLLILVVRGMAPGSRHPAYLTVAVVVFAVLLGFAMVTSNYGTAFRHRAKFIPALVVLYSLGRSGGSVSRAQRRASGS